MRSSNIYDYAALNVRCSVPAPSSCSWVRGWKAIARQFRGEGAIAGKSKRRGPKSASELTAAVRGVRRDEGQFRGLHASSPPGWFLSIPSNPRFQLFHFRNLHASEV